MTFHRRPLEGLRIFVTHIKDALMPHPSGKSAREMIMTELQNLEEREEGGLGVEFVEVKKGNRIRESGCQVSERRKLSLFSNISTGGAVTSRGMLHWSIFSGDA